MLRSKKQAILTFAGIALLAMPLAAQSAKFEVAAIKPCSGDTGGGGGRGGSGGGPSDSWSPGRLVLNCRTVVELIHEAYVQFADGIPTSPEKMLIDVMVPRPEGGPAWIRSDRYSIEAKAEGAPGEGEMKGPMLQALLEDRFQLKMGHETRETEVYTLNVAKGGLKIQQVQARNCTPLDITQFPPPELTPPARYCRTHIADRKGRNVIVDTEAMSIGEFCKTVLMFLDRPVVDQTGIDGLFNFKMEYVSDRAVDQTSDEPPAASIFTAVQQLGLKLEATKLPREFPVIDSVERPSEN